jgi:glycosyltransferase involved in cell wall biosynthesis
LASLSVTVITHNEAHNIEACLRSVSFADQMVVLDSGSTDDTLQIARSLGAEVSVSPDWRGFGIQKNRALAFDVYSFPRLSSYCGQYMRHSGWYPDRVTRLFRRNAARFSDDLVHEKVIAQGQEGQLQSHLLHESFLNFEAVLDKANRYSTAGAQSLLSRGKTASVGKAIGHGLWAFIRTYFLRLGFLDGRMGLILAISNAEGTYYRYLKLWLLQRDGKGTPKTQ